MLYLARVHDNSLSGVTKLKLLARQVSEHLWECISTERLLDVSELSEWQTGVLVLVTLDGQNQLSQVEDATDWVLTLVSQYLSQGVTPDFLRQEVERYEQWQQSLTLQSQEVRRRTLETVARRDEIQALEKSLQLEREELERRESQLQEREASLSGEG
jgi:hypothetical protein